MVPRPANPLWNSWANDSHSLGLYRRRCRLEAEEMTCAAQAAEILSSRADPGETLLDAGCGGGYYLHSLRKRDVRLEYFGVDFTPEAIALGQEDLCPRANLPTSRLVVGAIEDIADSFDNVLCFNVLTNNPHYGLPLWRLLACTRKRILLRESMGPSLVTRYTPDPYLDEGKKHIRVYHNIYPLDEVIALMQAEGFSVTHVVDQRTNDQMELVVDLPHFWRILVGERRP